MRTCWYCLVETDPQKLGPALGGFQCIDRTACRVKSDERLRNGSPAKPECVPSSGSR